ncbi:cell wall-binding repeat-containing protein [Cytobacillus oceanisediminis]|uniref:cell wall-binding repeat-containing protein n=1 Tax=Cytobacillus oceanisediminis TaxID=665099 RepID=UPI002494ED4A|nr:cell wall-binding repeat-containing protein [Cytobacillus oceanisediminis]
MIKKALPIFLVLSLFLGSFGPANSLAGETNDIPTYHETNKFLTDAALAHNIPPEIVKTLAYQESGWNQFKDGKPYVAPDGGIGIMQVTNDPRFDEELLKTDIEYNIDAGLQKLDEKFRGVDGKLPTLNNNDRDVLESWYFAILAYNGRVEENSPLKLTTDGSRNEDAYQEKFFKLMNDSFYIGMDIHPIPFDFKPEDFTYSGAPDHLLSFNKSNYQIPEHLLHKTEHKFTQNDILLSADSANFRAAPTSLSKSLKKLPSGEREAVRILDKSFAYDQSNQYGLADDKMRFRQYVWYKVEMQDGRTAYTASSDLKHLGKRLYGKTRYDTAVSISQEGWENGADTVVLAYGEDFPDALAGTPLAYQLDAPMLLTKVNSLPDPTKAEIERLKPKVAYLLGGTGAISDTVAKELKSLGIIEINRLGGKTRFETANEIAMHLPNKGDKAVLANGRNFPDALTIAPYAARNGYPILLTEKNQIPAATATILKDFNKTLVSGGYGVISDNAISGLKSVERFRGKDRFETNADIVKKLKLGNEQAYVATGYNFADALTGAVLAAKNNSHLLLTRPTSIDEPIKATILEQNYDHFRFLGGKSVVGVENELGKLID